MDELMSCNLDLELVDTVADKDLDVLTSLIQDDVCSSRLWLFACKLLQSVSDRQTDTHVSASFPELFYVL